MDDMSPSVRSSGQRWVGWTYDLVAYPRQSGVSSGKALALELAAALQYVPDRPSGTPQRAGRGTAVLTGARRVMCELDVIDEPPAVVVFSVPQLELESTSGIVPLITDEREDEWRRPFDGWLFAALVRVHVRAPLLGAAAGPDAYGDVTCEAILARDPGLRRWATLFMTDEMRSDRLVWLPRVGAGATP